MVVQLNEHKHSLCSVVCVCITDGAYSISNGCVLQSSVRQLHCNAVSSKTGDAFLLNLWCGRNSPPKHVNRDDMFSFQMPPAVVPHLPELCGHRKMQLGAWVMRAIVRLRFLGKPITANPQDVTKNDEWMSCLFMSQVHQKINIRMVAWLNGV